MREAAREHRTSLVTTRSIATSVREDDLIVRRLSTDLRFIRRFRQGNISPKTASEIIFNEQIVPFVLFHSQANEIIIFGDIDIVHAAASVSFICVDGTFSRCPRTHYQLVTCHAVCWNGFSFPFVFALLPDKKSATYSALFTSIDSITRQKFNMNVFSRTNLTVSCDFERGLLKALSRLDCFVKCCYFHQTRHYGDIWRRGGSPDHVHLVKRSDGTYFRIWHYVCSPRQESRRSLMN